MKCTRCLTSLEEGDIRCPVCGLIVPERAGAAPVARQVLRCGECNAALAYSAKHQNPVCGFCGAVMHVEEPVDPVEHPEARVSLSVTHEQAKAALKTWLSKRGFFAPTKLAAESTVDSVHPLWWAAWVCDVDAKVSWTADSNEGSARSDWAPHSGQFPMQRLNLLISASRGLTGVETRGLTEHYNLAPTEAVPTDSQEVEQFDAQRSAARRVVADAITSEAIAEATRRVPGHRHRNVRAHAMMTGLSTRRLALPAWVMVYRFEGKPYRAVVHGQNASVVLGDSPTSIWKILGVIFGTVLGIAVIGWLITLFR
jgi:hypothetical protein